MLDRISDGSQRLIALTRRQRDVSWLAPASDPLDHLPGGHFRPAWLRKVLF
jgi:hypothetical protein